MPRALDPDELLPDSAAQPVATRMTSAAQPGRTADSHSDDGAMENPERKSNACGTLNFGLQRYMYPAAILRLGPSENLFLF